MYSADSPLTIDGRHRVGDELLQTAVLVVSARGRRTYVSDDVISKISSKLEDMLALLPRHIVIELINMVERAAGYARRRANEWPCGHYDVRQVRDCLIGDGVAGRLMVIGDASFVQQSR